MFAHGSNVDADHRRTDIDADAATVANTNFRSHEAAGSRADVSAKPVSYNTTYRATVISTYRPAVRGAVASTFSGADIVTDCPADCLADDGPDGSASASADTSTDRGADASTFGTTNVAANDASYGEANRGADGGASTATDTGTDGGAYSITFSTTDCAADGVSDGEAFAITLGAADDSFSNSETFATALIASDCAADGVADGEAFRGTDDSTDGTAVAPADYFAANHITTTYSDSDHIYAYDVNSDVCSHRLAVISTRATPYGGALQHANNRCAVSTAISEPDCIANISAVAAAEPCSLGNSDCEPDGRADSPPIDLARTDHVRSVAVADSLANSVDRAHAPRTSRSAGEHHSGSGYVGRDLDRRGLRRRGEHLPFIRRRYPCGGRGFDRSAAQALVRRRLRPPRAERRER